MALWNDPISFWGEGRLGGVVFSPIPETSLVVVRVTVGEHYYFSSFAGVSVAKYLCFVHGV